MLELAPIHAEAEVSFNESHARKEIFRRRLVNVVEAIEDASLWCDGEENEHGLMNLLMDAKNLASAA